MADEYRIEKDSLGEMRVPADALWGAQTQRALENFPISGLRFPREFIAALGGIKKAAAETNVELGLLDGEVGSAIAEAAQEVVDGGLDAHFVLDIFQTGSGTSTNMNANEVIARRAAQILGEADGLRRVHPNDHVNLGQSSNDVIPTAMQVAAAVGIRRDLLPSLSRLRGALAAKADEFDHVLKSGRTHLMDATPVRLGQEFAGFTSQVAHAVDRIEATLDDLAELPLGGTAVGTGINTHPEFAARAIARLSEATGIEFREAADHFERQATRDVVVSVHGSLNALAVSLTKIANDIRWLGSGPTSGLFEISLPAIQPGSSIMPGKVNPVIPEAVTMVAAQVMGNQTTVTVGGMGGYFELNLMMPGMAYALLQSIALLDRAADVFAGRCIDGIRANRERARELLELNPSIATALNAHIGYDQAAAVAKEAARSFRSVRDVVKEKGLIPDDKLDQVLDVRGMTEPGIP